MRLLRPGSALWLLAHEFRLGWRGLGQGKGAPDKKARKKKGAGDLVMISLAVVGFAILIGGGVALGFVAQRFPLPLNALTVLIFAAGSLMLLTLMLSQAISLSVQALYERRDMDLLLSSPLTPRVVMTVRSVGIALVTSTLYLMVATPFVITASLLGRPEWIGLIGLLVGLILLACAIGMVLTLALFAAIGPRRTRVVAQVLGGLVGGAVFLASQAYNLRPREDETDPSAFPRMLDQITSNAAFAPDGPLAWPVLAVAGDPLAALAMLAAGLVPFAAIVWILGPYFARAATRAAGQTAGSRKPLRGVDGGFAQGLTRAMLRKELRLLARDPQLISQILLRLLYLMPLGFVLYRNADSLGGIAFGAVAVVIMAGQLAGSFAWITISAEDAPDLLGSAPIERAAGDRAKLAAALAPTFALTGLALAGFALLAPAAGVVVMLGCIASAASSGLINLWRQKPASRKAFNQQRKGYFLIGLAEFLVQVLWGAATGLMIAGQPWGGGFAVVAVLIVLSLRRPPARRYAPAH